MIINDVCKYGIKSSIKAGEANDGEYMFFTSSSDESKRYSEYQYDCEGIIMGTGGNATLHYYNGKFSTSTDCVVLLTNSNVRCKYLFYILKSKIDVLEAGFKGAGLKHTNKNYIGNIDIGNVPSIKKQDEIIKVFDNISNISNSLNEKINLLDEFVKARFVEMFGTNSDPKYKTKNLVELTGNKKENLVRGPFGGSLKVADFVSEGYLVYEQRHAIHNDFEYEKYYISEEKFKTMKRFEVKPGDMIVSCSGVTLGRIAMLPNNAKKGIINQALLKISLDNSIVNNDYFIHLFRSDDMQESLFGFSKGSGIPNLPSMDELKRIRFICPPIDKQNEFSLFVEQIDKSKFIIQKQIDETKELFNKLMQDYFG